jgi:hypothetical protein
MSADLAESKTLPPSGHALQQIFAPAQRTILTRASIALAAGAVIAAASLSLLRQPGLPAVNTIWAEDGTIFLSQALTHSFLGALTTSYNGYYMLLQRVLVEPVSWFPPGYAAAMLAVEAAVINALFALVVYVASAAALRSRLLRAAVAMVAVLPPVGMSEILNNVSNVHWSGLYALFWVALWVPAHRAGRAVASAVAFLVAFTNILGLVLLPLMVIRVAVRRDRHSAVLAAIVAAGLASDLIGLATGSSTRNGGIQFDPSPGVRAFFTRVIPASLLGEQIVGPVMLRPPTRYIMLAFALLILLLALGIYRHGSANWPVALTAWIHAAGFWLIAQSFGGMTPRYAAVAMMLIVAGLAALVAPGRRPEESARPESALISQFALIAYVCLVGAIIAVNFREPTVRGSGPSWTQAVAEARRDCAAMPPDQLVLVPIAPPGWTAPLPCFYVVR